MAERCGDIVYRSAEREGVLAEALADDDAALVKAYEKALKSFQGTKSADNLKQEEEEFLEFKHHDKEPDDCTVVTEQQWAVGSRCLAKWSEDGLLYPAVLVWVKEQRCQVKFDGYGNEEELHLSELLPEVVEQPANNQQWTVGAQCQAVWSGDGLTYPGVLVWVEGHRGRVLFDVYGNEEELELSALLRPQEQELNVNTLTEAWQCDPDGSSSSDWRKMEKQKILASKEDFSTTLLSSCSSDTDEGQSCECCDMAKKQRRKKGSPKAQERDTKEGAQAPFSLSPRYLSFPPPPTVLPPRSRADESVSGMDSDIADLSSMLLSWYLCGYHSGYYMAIQQSKDRNEKVKEKGKANCKHGSCQP